MMISDVFTLGMIAAHRGGGEATEGHGDGTARPIAGVGRSTPRGRALAGAWR